MISILVLSCDSWAKPCGDASDVRPYWSCFPSRPSREDIFYKRTHRPMFCHPVFETQSGSKLLIWTWLVLAKYLRDLFFRRPFCQLVWRVLDIVAWKGFVKTKLVIGEPTNNFYSGGNGEHYVFALRVFLPLEESIVSIDTSIDDTIRISLAFAIRCIDESLHP